MIHIETVQHWLDEATQNGAFKLADVAQILNALSGLRADFEDSQKKSELISRLQETTKDSNEPQEPVETDEDTKR